MMKLIDNGTFTHNGRTFQVTFPYDDDATPPWEREDGYGPVSEWTTRAKRPGERVLCYDRGATAQHGLKRYYDFEEAMKLARRDGWGSQRKDVPRSPGQMAAWAVDEDFDRLRRWCNNEWFYVGVVVTLVDDEGETASLWGIESDSVDYLDQMARELAEEIVHRVTHLNPCAL